MTIREIYINISIYKCVCVHTSVQDLDRRTHDEIVRGLLGCTTLKGYMDKCKLNFVQKLISLPPDNLVKEIFMYQSYNCLVYGYGRQTSCILVKMIYKSAHFFHMNIRIDNTPANCHAVPRSVYIVLSLAREARVIT